MSERKDAELLADILEAAERILTYTAGSDYDDFLTDTKTQDAVIRNPEIIGEAAKHNPAKAALSPREEEVLHLISLGLSNAAIASELYISEATVKVHVRHILEKLGARSRTEAAIRFADRQPYAAPST